MRECPSGNGCCTAAVHCFLLAARHGDGIRQHNLYRDMRTCHPKLRPVGTAVEGVTIAGACQGPKTAESAASGLAAAAGDVGLVPVPACQGSPPPARRRLCARGASQPALIARFRLA